MRLPRGRIGGRSSQPAGPGQRPATTPDGGRGRSFWGVRPGTGSCRRGMLLSSWSRNYREGCSCRRFDNSQTPRHGSGFRRGRLPRRRRTSTPSWSGHDATGRRAPGTSRHGAGRSRGARTEVAACADNGGRIPSPHRWRERQWRSIVVLQRRSSTRTSACYWSSISISTLGGSSIIPLRRNTSCCRRSHRPPINRSHRCRGCDPPARGSVRRIFVWTRLPCPCRACRSPCSLLLPL